jgi:uncharacterized protein with von Willebrand factor type A (vWA) domain
VRGVAFGYTHPSHSHEVPMRRIGLAIAFALSFLLPLAAKAQESAKVRNLRSMLPRADQIIQ